VRLPIALSRIVASKASGANIATSVPAIARANSVRDSHGQNSHALLIREPIVRSSSDIRTALTDMPRIVPKAAGLSVRSAAGEVAPAAGASRVSSRKP
jgi:hypothetical protein